jgi:UDP-3-O-[3-hydroxymyristoyl] glucosamine N-acyltransferase
MINPRFYKKSASYKLSEIIKLIGAEILYSSDLLIHDIKQLEEADVGDISFLSNSKYITQFQNTKASCCIVPENFSQESNNGTMLLKVKNPYFFYAKLVDLFYSKAKTYPNKIMPSAYISDSATIGNNCYIGHNVVIEDYAIIGDNCVIESGTFIDYGVVIGNRALIYSNVSISYSMIGDDVVILAGAKIGQDGFGFATDKGIHKKIFHTGMVKIGNNVEIGSNTTIDRGSMNDTVIGDLCRIDNLVQVGHNAIIGRGSIIVAQTGISGSTTIGAYCALGGQAGLSGHIVLGDKVQVAAKAGVMKDVEPGVTVGGCPAVPIRDWHRQSIVIKQLIKKWNIDEN